MSAPVKFAYLILGGLLLLLGLVGLIFPIIPGVLFLIAAVYVLSKASRRFRRVAEADPRYQEMQRRFNGFGGLGAMDRLRLAGWMTLDASVKGIQAMLDGLTTFTATVISRCKHGATRPTGTATTRP